MGPLLGLPASFHMLADAIAKRFNSANSSFHGGNFFLIHNVYSDFGPIEGYISETVQDRR